jgi:hypothetical protein
MFFLFCNSEMDSLQERVQSWFSSFQSEIVSTISEAIHSTFERVEQNPSLFPRNKIDSVDDIFRSEGTADNNYIVNYKINCVKESVSQLEKEEKQKKLVEKLKANNILLGHHTQYHVDSRSRQSISQSEKLFFDTPFVDKPILAEQFDPVKQDVRESEDSPTNSESNEILEILRTMMLTLIQHEEKLQQLQEENDNLKHEITSLKQARQ